MYRLFAFARFYPYFAFCAAYVMGYVGRHFRRKDSPAGGVFYALTALFLVTGICWVIFRGDLHSDEWVRSLAGD